MSAPTIFICYSHKDEVWKERLVTQLGVLEVDVWDDRRIPAGADWFPEIERAIGRASVAILLISADSLTSNFILGQEVPRLLERRQKEGLRVIPLIVRPCAWKEVKWLSSIQAWPKDGRPLSGKHRVRDRAGSGGLGKEIAGRAGRCRGARPCSAGEDLSREAALDQPGLVRARARTGGARCCLGQPAHQRCHAGRLRRDRQDRPGQRLAESHGGEDWRGAERVFGWSFYSQGAAEGRQASADPFIAAALRWFGDPDPRPGHSVGKRRAAGRTGSEAADTARARWPRATAAAAGGPPQGPGAQNAAARAGARQPRPVHRDHAPGAWTT